MRRSISTKLLIVAGAAIGVLLLLAVILLTTQTQHTVGSLSDNYSQSLGSAARPGGVHGALDGRVDLRRP